MNNVEISFSDSFEAEEKCTPSLSLDQALIKTGGFGRFQILMIFVFMILRDMGTIIIYTTAINMKEQQYLCRNSRDFEFVKCDTELICESRQIQDDQLKYVITDGSLGPDLLDFEYKQDILVEDHIVNWYVTLDLMCYSPMKYMSMISWSYVGSGLGIILFFLPDNFGRKTTMVPILLVHIWLTYVAAFQKNLNLLKLATIAHGFLHIRATISYVQASEMVPNKDKSTVSTLINCFFGAEMLILGIFYKFIEPNTEKLMTFYFAIGTFACILYILFIPESPLWYLVNEGPNSQNAIKILNYIAKFNGSTYRVHQDTILSIKKEQDDNEMSLHKSSDNEKGEDIKITTKNLSYVFKEVKMLFSNQVYRSMHFKLMIMFIGSNVLHLLSLINAKNIKGNTYTICMVIGFCEVFGTVFSDKMISIIPDHKAMYMSISMIVVSSTIMIVFDLNPYLNYLLIFLQITSNGMAYNLFFIINETRTDSKVLSVSLELSYSASQFCTFLTPIVIESGKQITVFSYWFMGLIMLMTMMFIGPRHYHRQTDTKLSE